jgi:nitronate monooxygenase
MAAAPQAGRRGRTDMTDARARAAAFCASFGLRVPILQAPMASACPPALAAAVASAGGMGGLGALMSDGKAMRDWVRTFRSSSNGAFQINLWAPEADPVRDPEHEAKVRQVLSGLAGTEVPDPGPGPFVQDFAAQCEAMLEAAPAIASSIMGLFPPEVVAQMKARDMKWIANATTVAEALAAQAAGADAVVAQGSEAGGHRGSYVNAAAEQQLIGLFALLPQMADALEVPVVAAGGIMDGRAVAAALTLGASAVQLGTAFLRCPETALHPAYADAIPRTRPEDTVLTRGFSGRLARGIRNQVTEAFAGAVQPAPYPLQRALMAKVRDAAAAANDGTRMQAWAGQGASLARAEPAGEVVRRVWAEAEALLP